MHKLFLGSLAAVVAALLVAGGAVSSTSGTTETYVVLYKQQSVNSDAAATMEKAGGTLVYAYPQIGVAIAQSGSASFRDALLKDSNIENAAATSGFAYQL